MDAKKGGEKRKRSWMFLLLGLREEGETRPEWGSRKGSI